MGLYRLTWKISLLTVSLVLYSASARAEAVARVYGSCGAGCIQNALALPADGPGYQVVRLQRERYFGHPHLVHLIEHVGQTVARNGWGILFIGDMAQTNGGPMPSGHASHQSGLDVDIFFKGIGLSTAKRLDGPGRANAKPQSVLTDDFSAVSPERWRPEHARVLETLARQVVVDRIFVNPAIKRRLCRNFAGETWLHKVRPWWGHDGHFHVRLACPSDSPGCISQEKLAVRDGCDASLEWWFSAEARKAAGKRYDRSKPRAKPRLPAECVKLLGQ